MLEIGKKTIKAKLIFNPESGDRRESPERLSELLSQLQALQILPEVHIAEPDTPLEDVAQDALERGIQLFIVCGGDGTLNSTIGSLVGKPVTLALIPKGTQNNAALSLGIPLNDIPGAVKVLRRNHVVQMDVGHAQCAQNSRYFLEFCSVGLASALFASSDRIQHGNLAELGPWLETLISFPAAQIHLEQDIDQKPVDFQGHVVLVTNLPYTGAHFRLSEQVSCTDGLLDVFGFPDLTKIELLGIAVRALEKSPLDPRVKHYQVKRIEITTGHEMPVVADGFDLGKGPVTITIRPASLEVIAAL